MMKIFVISVVIFAMFVVPVFGIMPISTAKAPITGSVCNNAFVKSLQASNVQIFTDVKITGPFAYCAAEWSKHGTCCDGASLVQGFKAENDSIQKAVKGIKNLASDILTTSKVIRNGLKNMIVSFSKGQKSDPPKLVQNLDTIINSSVYSTIDTSSSTCWNFMVAKRGSALCSICSGRSAQFFTKSKILIGVSECEEAIDKCKAFYLDIQTFTTQYVLCLKPCQKSTI